MKLLLFLLALSSGARAADTLPRLNLSDVSVSGISSGAFMAVQMGVAHSKLIRGVASTAGGIYWCAEGDKNKSLTQCMSSPQQQDPKRNIDKARSESEKGAIDSVENLKSQRVYLYQSEKDFIIRPESVDKLAEFYKAFSTENLEVHKVKEGAHGFPTKNYGNPCSQMGSPWILKCGVDHAGDILKYFYGELAEPASGESAAANLQSFDQNAYGAAGALLYPSGKIYIPSACRKGEACRLHIAFHGCQMNPDFIQDKFAEHAGFNEWAESNHIVVLYPYSAKSADNPYACWDWFGFTGQDYVLKSGKQIAAIAKMIEALGVSIR